MLFSTAFSMSWLEGLLIVGTMWTAASSALAAAPSIPTSVATRSFSTSGPMPSLGSTSRPARSRPTSPSSTISSSWGRTDRARGFHPEAARPASRVHPRGSAGSNARVAVALIEHIVNATIVQRIGWLDLVELLGLVGDLVRVVALSVASCHGDRIARRDHPA